MARPSRACRAHRRRGRGRERRTRTGMAPPRSATEPCAESRRDNSDGCTSLCGVTSVRARALTAPCVFLGGFRRELEADERFAPDHFGIVTGLDDIDLTRADLDDGPI